ncbi:Indole-3-acetic acid-induced protein [Nymphaea thermarum]|nr:Indole-3-acetic acid-induced protein [Nymphaea thermarum]
MTYNVTSYPWLKRSVTRDELKTLDEVEDQLDNFHFSHLPTTTAAATQLKMVVLKNIAQNLQRKLSRSRQAVEMKEGHFAVMASFDGNSKRFTVPLCYLSNPAFVRLLDEAEEEYGFSQQNILTVPCDPTQLERILAADWRKDY